ncbi:hypothetical protein D3C87_1903200 [compost metagenome]
MLLQNYCSITEPAIKFKFVQVGRNIIYKSSCIKIFIGIGKYIGKMLIKLSIEHLF